MAGAVLGSLCLGDSWRGQVVPPGTAQSRLSQHLKLIFPPTFPSRAFPAMSLRPGLAAALRSQRQRDNKPNKFICCVVWPPHSPSLPPSLAVLFGNLSFPVLVRGQELSNNSSGSWSATQWGFNGVSMGFKWGLNWL